MSTNHLSSSRRRKDVRACWADHLAAHRKSGQTQVAYCRAHGLDHNCFTFWKRRLGEAPATARRHDSSSQLAQYLRGRHVSRAVFSHRMRPYFGKWTCRKRQNQSAGSSKVLKYVHWFH